MTQNVNIRALQYVRNTNGGATVENFIEDHEPIGELLWDNHREFIEIKEGRIFLSELGKEVLSLGE